MAAVLLGSKAVGSIVKLNENGTPVNYIVVHQGKPSLDYDDSCDGTWLLRQDISEKHVWDSARRNEYDKSTIHNWLNSTVLARYDEDIQTAIKQVKIPYRAGGVNGSNKIGANGLLTKIFLLSGYEVGATNSDGQYEIYLPVEGRKLDYFLAGKNSAAYEKRKAALNDTFEYWALRSPFLDPEHTEHEWRISPYGDLVTGGVFNEEGVRQAIILPYTLSVDEDGLVFVNLLPTAPESIAATDTAIGAQTSITWTAATDPDGTVVSYMLERSINGSGWTQIFSGNALTYTDTIGEWGTVAYRVCAVDNEGAAGDYATSNTYTVQEGVFYISGPASDMGEKTAPFDFTITTGISGDAQAVSGVTCTILLDGYTLHTDSTSTGEDTTVHIDVRAISSGTHTITAKADKEGYISAVEQYTFTTPEIAFPDGGKAEQLQDQTGKAIFPQTTAALVQGIAGKSLAGNLEELYSGLVYGEGLDTLLLSVLEG